MSIRAILALAVVLWVSPLAYARAQEAAGPRPAPGARPPVLDHFQSVKLASAAAAPSRMAVASDRDLTSEKIAIAVVVVIIAVVVIRSVK